MFLFGDYVYDHVQGVSWIRDPQRLYRIKSCYCSSSTDFKSVSYSFPDCIFDYFDVAFGFFQFAEVCFEFINIRKDTYGVFSEPVDPNEVSS